jgi:hypothetical protein
MVTKIHHRAFVVPSHPRGIVRHAQLTSEIDSMPLDQPNQDDFKQRRLQRLELRYRRAQFVLAGAQAVYDSVRAMPVVDELRMRQALQRVEQTRELLLDIQCTIEYLEDQERVA